MKNKLNNIILIDTYNSLGTGIILPCRYDKISKKEEDRDYNWYLILTNYHVIHNGEKIEDPVKELSEKDIHLTIFDKGMKLVLDEDFEIIDMEAEFSLFQEEDIVAMLVKIRKAYEITGYCQIGEFEDMQEGDVLYTKGFPGILQEDTEAMPIQLVGSLQMNCYKGGKIGTYRIRESFHFYSDYRDQDMFSGLSGGPVYIEQDGKMRLIGMNQGIFADNYGDSPYKLIRFVEIKHILEYLRQKGCILYSLLYGNISVIWIKDKSQIEKEEENSNKEAICILGGSGAGKSSFVENLTQHAKVMETVGDGQTTRTDIYYYFSLRNDKPTAKVSFLDKKLFAEKMYRVVFPDLLAFIFEHEFGFRKIDIRVEPYQFLRANLDYLIILLKKNNIEEEKYQCILSLCNSSREEVDVEEIYQCYLYFCNIMYQFINCYNIEPYVLKRIFDIYTREKIIKSLISLCEESKNNTEFYWIDGVDLKEFYLNGIKTCKISETELNKNLQILPYNIKELYVNDVLNMKKLDEKEDDNKEYKFSKELCNIFEEQKGIFSYEEVRYLFDDPIKKERINDAESNEKLFGFLKYEIMINDVKDSFFLENEFNKIESIYEKFYERVMEKIENEKTILQQGISLVDMTLKDKRLINLCVRTDHKKSLSAFVNYIEVKDSYYYEYAVPIYESRHNEVLLIDTCGLDHIDKGKGNRYTLAERVRDIKNKLKKEKYDLNNIIYLKKLDSGKPTEISDIFAYIADIDIKGGLYCVFTGIDIYEKSNDDFFAKNKNWHINNSFDGYPKVMQYLIDKQNKEELLRMCNCVSYRKEDLYRVMSQNVITFCANRNLNEKWGKYQENNVVGIRNLFESIFQKETELLQLSVDEEKEVEHFEKIIEANKESIKKELKKLITVMFDLASVTKWQRYYWQTLNANLNRYIKGEKGFARSYNHTWNYLFKEGYRMTFEKEYSEDFYKLFEKYEGKTYSLVRQLKDKYVETIIDDENYLKKMYEESCKNNMESIINVYEIEKLKEKKKETIENTFCYAKLLQKITNFGLLIRTCSDESGINKLVDLFLTMLKLKNKEKMTEEINFFETRVDIRNKTDELIEILKSYGFEKDAVKALFCKRVEKNQSMRVNEE